MIIIAGQNIKNKLADIYLNKIYKRAAKLIEVKDDDVVLDFGCERQRLKPYIKRGQYVGFDCESKHSDIPYYQKTSPTVFVALNVIEHLKTDEIKELCLWLKNVNPRKIIISLPTESSTTKFFSWVFARELKHEVEHYQTWQSVCRILREHFRLVRFERIFLMQWLMEWEMYE